MEANLNNSIGPNSYTSYRIASDLLNELDNLSLTTPIDTILFEYEIKTCPFSLIKAHVPSNSPIFKTAGALVEFKDNYYILYDDNDSIQRIRWTKGHELGHFFLKHPFDNLENYSIYETEANYFAS